MSSTWILYNNTEDGLLTIRLCRLSEPSSDARNAPSDEGQLRPCLSSSPSALRASRCSFCSGCVLYCNQQHGQHSSSNPGITMSGFFIYESLVFTRPRKPITSATSVPLCALSFIQDSWHPVHVFYRELALTYSQIDHTDGTRRPPSSLSMYLSCPGYVGSSSGFANRLVSAMALLRDHHDIS